MEKVEIEYIRLNIGGTIFKCYRKTLSTFQESKLHNLDKDKDDFDSEHNEFYFDRNPLLFAYIIDACRKGAIHLPKDICGTTFKQELEFWNIPLDKVAPCCLETLYRSKDDIDTIETLITHEEQTSVIELKQEREKISFQTRLWLFLDDPSSSKLAQVLYVALCDFFITGSDKKRKQRVWNTVMSLLVVVSTFIDVLSTVSAFQQNFTEAEIRSLEKVSGLLSQGNKTMEKLVTMKPKDYLFYIIVACHVVLTLEFLLCFIACKNKRSYMLCFIRMSTLVGYTSFWIMYALYINLAYIESWIVITVYLFLSYLQIAKIARLFYFTKRIPAFAIMGLTFRSSIHEFKILAFLLGILVTIFGYFFYAAEVFYNPKMSSILEGIYWALITVTTVGYGDYVPKTAFGHVIASACAVVGILVLALPVGIIASNFYKFYNYHGYSKKHIEAMRENHSDKNLTRL
ncbi:potassium voltage-gated channel protein Shaw-like [Ruditapes philippinarum]|uniref:potassium voltage-gated channel protein Shaw-like n=1 Tax=Ruditapes philippinarum TaxID=129788 RepID=UPI00295AA92D|nr:potassium voltage-gated channel protein Shaw-like [Ruditapes philippinarum]